MGSLKGPFCVSKTPLQYIYFHAWGLCLSGSPSLSLQTASPTLSCREFIHVQFKGRKAAPSHDHCAWLFVCSSQFTPYAVCSSQTILFLFHVPTRNVFSCSVFFWFGVKLLPWFCAACSFIYVADLWTEMLTSSYNSFRCSAVTLGISFYLTVFNIVLKFVLYQTVRL